MIYVFAPPKCSVTDEKQWPSLSSRGPALTSTYCVISRKAAGSPGALHS